MKRLISMLLIGIAIFWFGCSKEDNPATPESNTEFTGTCVWVADLDTGVTTVLEDGRILITGQKAEWYDSTNIALTTGKSFWDVGWVIEKDGNAQLWATTELVVDGGRGKWELTWTGTRTPTGTGTFTEWVSPFKIEGDAVGKGVEGEVLGMEAKWTYTMDFNGDFSTLFYKSKGYIK